MNKMNSFAPMQASARYFNELANSLPVFIFEIDSSGGLTFLNHQATKALNCSVDDIGRRHWSDMLAPEDRERAAKDVATILQGKNCGQHLYRVVPRGAKGFDGFFLLSVVFQNKKAMGLRGLVLDISEQLTKHHQLQQANEYLEMEVVKLNRKLSTTIDDLKAAQTDLYKYRKKMALMNQELSEANNAVTTLARNLDHHQNSDNHDIALAISLKILPLLANLRTVTDKQELKAVMDTLELSLRDLTQQLGDSERLSVLLSTTEMKIAAMIRNGMTSSKIAKALFISGDTVKTHRRNIRRKLGLKNTCINLKSFLDHKWG